MVLNTVASVQTGHGDNVIAQASSTGNTLQTQVSAWMRGRFPTILPSLSSAWMAR
jgi:hypothetical protein